MTQYENVILIIGLASGTGFIAVLLWSICFPERRLWPPQIYSNWKSALVWAGTLGIFVSAIWLGISGWGSAPISPWLRFSLGPILLVLSNLAVWAEAARFGYAQTSGAPGELVMSGLYKYSRHPQYVADVAMLIGWFALTASMPALPVLIAGVTALLIAPFAEEPWLKEKYGDAYRDYTRQVPRFLGRPRKVTEQ